MLDISEIKQLLVINLQTIAPKEIILFGSHARKTQGRDSDVDVYVVTKDAFIPETYREKRDLVRKVSRPISELRQKVAIDLLVHTEPMSKRFFALNGSLAREIRENGLSLL
jgi:predicted nucleotidyltransferase